MDMNAMMNMMKMMSGLNGGTGSILGGLGANGNKMGSMQNLAGLMGMMQNVQNPQNSTSSATSNQNYAHNTASKDNIAKTGNANQHTSQNTSQTTSNNAQNASMQNTRHGTNRTQRSAHRSNFYTENNLGKTSTMSFGEQTQSPSADQSQTNSMAGMMNILPGLMQMFGQNKTQTMSTDTTKSDLKSDQEAPQDNRAETENLAENDNQTERIKTAENSANTDTDNSVVTKDSDKSDFLQHNGNHKDIPIKNNGNSNIFEKHNNKLNKTDLHQNDQTKKANDVNSDFKIGDINLSPLPICEEENSNSALSPPKVQSFYAKLDQLRQRSKISNKFAGIAFAGRDILSGLEKIDTYISVQSNT